MRMQAYVIPLKTREIPIVHIKAENCDPTFKRVEGDALPSSMSSHPPHYNSPLNILHIQLSPDSSMRMAKSLGAVQIISPGGSTD